MNLDKFEKTEQQDVSDEDVKDSLKGVLLAPRRPAGEKGDRLMQGAPDTCMESTRRRRKGVAGEPSRNTGDARIGLGESCPSSPATKCR